MARTADSVASAVPSASAALPPGPVDIYCGAIADQWRQLDALCTEDQRKLVEYEQAREAVGAAVTKCKELFGPSYAAGRIAFEEAHGYVHGKKCDSVFKYEWGALPALTRLRSNCSPSEISGLVADSSPCSHSYECRSGVCNRGVCSKKLSKDEDCSGVDPVAFGRSALGRSAPCEAGLYCDRAPAPPLLAGYPPSTTTRRSDFSVRPGRVAIEPVAQGGAAKPVIKEWASSTQPYLRRCFEAALAVDPKTKGSLTLDLVAKGATVVVASEVPDGLRDCAVRVSHDLFRRMTGRVEIRFSAPADEKPLVPAVRSGKCRAATLGSPCETSDDCTDELRCGDWKCGFDWGADCRTDEDCFVSESCLHGLCVDRILPGQACSSSADCRATICISGSCQPMCATKHGPDFSRD